MRSEPTDLEPGVQIIARKGRGHPRASMPEEDQWLEEGPSTPEGRELLERLHSGERHLRCLCGWRLHVRQRQGGCALVMNPGQRQQQEEAGTSCWLCMRSDGWKPLPPPEAPRPRPEPADEEGLILRIRTDTDPGELTDSEWSAWAAGSGVSPESVHARMTRWVMEAGWHELPGPVAERALWRGMGRVLMQHPIPVGEGAQVTFPGQLTWTPSGQYRGGLSSFAHRVRRHWPGDARYRCEVWALGLVEDGGMRIGRFATTLQVIDARGLVHEITVPTDIVPGLVDNSRLWMRGPYLTLLAGAPHPRTHALEWYRMAIRAVASRHSPVPVDSGDERGVVGLLQEQGVPFTRPLVVDADGLLPDLVLRGERWAMLEVQGRRDPEYLERKARMHIRMRAAAQARGWAFLRYDPHEGKRETLRDLADRLTENGF